MRTVFTLASGRSGTHFLYQLIRRNSADCVAKHETYGFNPSMFGRPIYDCALGDSERTRKLLERKQRIVARCGGGIYVETSHAFLKSWSHLASECFPQSKFVHLIRDPLKVAKSEASREVLIKRMHLPLCHYRGGDGQWYFFWSLTGREPIFRPFADRKLTRFQWYVIQWIEIENRAMRFLDNNGGASRCFTMHSPHDLNDARQVERLFDFLDLKRRQKTIAIEGRRNKNWRPTVVTGEDEAQFAEVIQNMPAEYLAIFRGEPYAALPWAGRLAGSA
jgi:hypothetical protein